MKPFTIWGWLAVWWMAVNVVIAATFIFYSVTTFNVQKVPDLIQSATLETQRIMTCVYTGQDSNATTIIGWTNHTITDDSRTYTELRTC